MSDFPSNWRECMLSEVVEKITSGGTPKADNPHLYGGGIPFLKIDDITSSSKYLRSHKITINERGLSESSAKIVPTGTLLLTMYGTIGRCCITTYPVATNQAIASFLGHPEVELEYLYYALESKADEFATASSQTTQANISAGILKQTPIAIPPLPEQKKIAEILSGIDLLILATQRRIDRIRTAQVGLANSWQKQISLEKEDGTFGDLIASIDSGWSPACDEVPPKSGEWGVLKVSAVSKGYFCEEESKRLPANLQPRDQYRIKKNDVLITRANGNLDLVGRGAIVEEEPRANLLMSDKILRLNPNPSSDRNFLLLLLNSRHVRQQIETAVGGSTGAKNIGQSLLRQISTSVPISEDQAKIGKLSRSLSLTLSVGKKRLNYLVSLKKGLSSDLLSGRKRVSI